MEAGRAPARSSPPAVTHSLSFGLPSAVIPFSCGTGGRPNRYMEERQRLRQMKAESLAVRLGYHQGPLIPIDSPPSTEQEAAAASNEQNVVLSGSSLAKATQQLTSRGTIKRRPSEEEAVTVETASLHTSFALALKGSPPPSPPTLLKLNGRSRRLGKVRVLVRLSSNNKDPHFLEVESKRKQVTLTDPAAPIKSQFKTKHAQTVSPKTFVFDAVFPDYASQSELCGSSLIEVLHSVLSGTDGCVVSYGQAKLGKTHTMVGGDELFDMYGVMPTGIIWLFRLVENQRQKTKRHFAISVSALEVNSLTDQVCDLLADQHAGSVLHPPISASVESLNQTVLAVVTPEAAAYYLDCAFQSWMKVKATFESEEHLAPMSTHSHFCFTVHVFQKIKDSSGKSVVLSSRLHFWDLGSCGRIQNMALFGLVHKQGEALHIGSLSSLGAVLLALLNGEKRIPHRENKLTLLLQESVGSLSCRTHLIVHISSLPQHYHETLGVLQLVSRIRKIRKRRGKFSETSSSGGDNSVEDFHHHQRRWRILNNRIRLPIRGSDTASSRDSDSSRGVKQMLLSPMSTATDSSVKPTFLTVNSTEKEESRQEIKQVIGVISDSLDQPEVCVSQCSLNSSDRKTSTGEETGATVIYVGPSGQQLSDTVCTDHEATPSADSRAVVTAESYMLEGPSTEDVERGHSDVKSTANSKTETEEGFNDDEMLQWEERGEPVGQSDSAGHSPSPAMLASPTRTIEKSAGRSLLSLVEEPACLAVRHPHHQELTDYVNSLLKHSPQPPILSGANLRRRTTSLRLPAGNSWTSTPSDSFRQRTVSELANPTVACWSEISETGYKTNLYKHHAFNSSHSRMGSYARLDSCNSSDFATTIAGTGTLTSLLGRLLAVGSMDGFASTFLPPTGSLHSITCSGGEGTSKKDGGEENTFSRSLSARHYSRNHKPDFSTPLRQGETLPPTISTVFVAAAGNQQESGTQKSQTAPDLSVYSFDNLCPDNLDARLEKHHGMTRPVPVADKQNTLPPVARESYPLQRSLSSHSAPIRRVTLDSHQPYHKTLHTRHASSSCKATKAHNEVMKQDSGCSVGQHNLSSSTSVHGSQSRSVQWSNSWSHGRRASCKSVMSSACDSVFDSDHTCKSSVQLLAKKSKCRSHRRQVSEPECVKGSKSVRSTSDTSHKVYKHDSRRTLAGAHGSVSVSGGIELAANSSMKCTKEKCQKSQKKKPWHARLFSRLLGRKQKLRRMGSDDGFVLSLASRQERLRSREDLPAYEKETEVSAVTVMMWTENGRTLIAC